MSWYTPPGGSGGSSGGSGVSSVGLSLPSTFSVSNSPLTSAGTITATYVSQSGNAVFAAPSTGNGVPSFRFLASADISSFAELTANKNQPDGYAGLDSNGQLVGVFIGRYDTEANINNITLSSGELASTTDTYSLRLGNGVASGGIAISENGTTCVYLPSAGSSGINGINLLAAYARATGLNPTSDKPVELKLGAGVFDIRSVGPLNLETPYISIIGEGKGVTTIYSDITLTGYINLNSDNVKLANMTLRPGLATVNQVMNFNAGAGTGTYSATNTSIEFTDIEILQSSNAAASNNINFNSSITVLGGTYTRVTTNHYLMGTTNAWTVSATFEDCVSAGSANSRCFGGRSAGFNTFTGTIRRCRNNTGSINLTVSGGLVEYSSLRNGTSNGDAFRVASGVSTNRFFYNRILTNGTGLAIGDGGLTGLNAQIGHNIIKNGIGPGITNIMATGSMAQFSGFNIITDGSISTL